MARRGGAVALCLVALAIAWLSGGFRGRQIDRQAGITNPPATAASVQPAPSALAETPAPTASPAPTQRASGRSATIRSIGDIIIHAPLLRSAYIGEEKRYDFTKFFSMIEETMGAADYTVANVEGPLGGKGDRGYKGYPQFNTPPELIDALKACGVDMLTLANNHALDTYFDGLKRTVDNVEAAGLEHVGAYRSQAEYDTPKVVEIGGIRVGFVNYTTGTNGLEKKSDEAARQYGLRYAKSADFQEDIEALRQAGAEVVVAYMHWGTEYQRKPGSAVKSMAKRLVAAGADVIVGGHPHVVQPAEYVTANDAQGNPRRALVLYSMGNFLSDQRSRYRDSGVVFEFTLAENEATGEIEVTAPRYIPTYVWRTKPGKKYDYRVLAVGDYLDEAPEGMGEQDSQNLSRVWEELNELLGSEVAQAANH